MRTEKPAPLVVQRFQYAKAFSIYIEGEGMESDDLSQSNREPPALESE